MNYINLYICACLWGVMSSLMGFSVNTKKGLAINVIGTIIIIILYKS